MNQFESVTQSWKTNLRSGGKFTVGKKRMNHNHLSQKGMQFAQNILDGLSAHVAVVDTDGTILAVNEAWRQFGLDNALDANKEMVGANYLAVCDAAAELDVDTATEFAAGLRDVLAGNRSFFQLEYPCHSPQEERWFVGRITHFPEGTGAVRAIVAHENITARKMAEERMAKSQFRYQTLFDKASDAIFVCDLDGRILEANQVACRRLGYDLAEFRQLKMSDIDPIEYGQLQPKRLAPLALDGTALFETIHVSKTGKVVPTEMNVRYFDYDERPAILHIARDISGRKETIRAERKSRKLAEALVDTAATINSSLDLDQILQRVLTNVGRVVPHEQATIFLRDGRFATLVNLTDGGNELKVEQSERITIANFPTLTYMLENQRPLLVPDVKTFSGWVQLDGRQKSGAYLGAPLITKGELLGFINLSSRQENAFKDKDAVHLQAFANQAAIAIKNARLFTAVAAFNTQLEAQVAARTEQLQHQKEKLEAVIYNSADKILLVDTDGRITLANPKFYDTFGLSSDGVIGQLLTAVLPIKETTALDNRLQQAMNTRTGTTVEAVAMLPDDREIDLEIRLTPIANGKISGIVCTMRNTTHFKDAARIKDAFVSNVCHELRTPITSITLYHQLLQVKPDMLSTYLPILERETKRLGHIVEDLLCISRLDQSRASLNHVSTNLNQIVSDLVTDRQSIAAFRQISLETGELAQLPLLQVDVGLIEQVISILLTNALDYTPSGGRVCIKTLLRSQAGIDWCGIAVSDTGPGIAPEEQTKIFERFYRGKIGIARHSAGTGLGLAIASEIAAWHKGKFELQSSAGEGSTFILWIPAQKIL